MRKSVVSVIVALACFAFISSVRAHCEVPCGIYDDPVRVKLIGEHAKTIEKSMKKIKELREGEDKNYNQLVRWINNKEEHAQKLQKIVWQYFMTQRIKPAPKDSKEREKYIREVTLLHQMLVQAMKCKQTTDVEHVTKLRELLEKFEKSYFDRDHEHGHMHEGHDH